MTWSKEERAAWRVNEDRINAKLRADLAAEHGVSGHKNEPKLWDLAWEYGHAYGAVEVRNYYGDLAELLK